MPFSANSPSNATNTNNSISSYQPTISSPSSPQKQTYPIPFNGLTTSPQQIPLILSPGKYDHSLPSTYTIRVNIASPASPQKTAAYTNNFAQRAFLNPIEFVPHPLQISSPTSNTPPCSPNKTMLQSPRKRGLSASNNENVSPLLKLKKTRVYKADVQIRKLLLKSPGENFNRQSWVKIYSKIKQENLSNAKFLEAINAEPDTVQREKCLSKLLELKLSICCLAWSILPDLDVLSKSVANGYYSSITLAFFEHSLNQFFLQDSIPADLTALIKEGFNLALSHQYPHAQQIIADWKNDKPIFLRAGWSEHATSLLVYKNFVAYGNRGESHPNFNFLGIKYFTMTNPEKFNEAFINKINLRLTLSELKDEQMDFLENKKMEQELGLIPFFNQAIKAQKGGYCSYALCHMNLRSLLFLSSLTRTKNWSLQTGSIELAPQSNAIDHKKVKQFDRVYNLAQVEELIYLPEFKNILSQKDAFKIFCNIRSKIDYNKFRSFSHAQQQAISSFFNRFISNNPLKIDDCITDFTLTYKASNKIAKELLTRKEVGTFLIRQSNDPQTLVVNYVDTQQKVRYLKIKKINDNYTHGKLTLSRLHDLTNSRIGTLWAPFMDSIQQKSLSD